MVNVWFKELLNGRVGGEKLRGLVGSSSVPSVVPFTQALTHEPYTQTCRGFLCNRPLFRGLRASVSVADSDSVLEFI